MTGAADREELGMKDLGVAQDALVMLGTEDEDKALTVFLQSRHAAVRLVQPAHAQERIVREAPQTAQSDGRGFRGVRVPEIVAVSCHEFSPRPSAAWVCEGSKPHLLSAKRARESWEDFPDPQAWRTTSPPRTVPFLPSFAISLRDTSPPRRPR